MDNTKTNDWSTYDEINGINLEQVDEFDDITEEESKSIRETEVAKALGLTTIVSEMTDYAVSHGAFDTTVYKDTRDSFQSLIDLEKSGEKIVDGYSTIQEDSFLALFKNKPKLTNSSRLTPMGEISSALLKASVKSDEFKTLRRLCKNDVLNSAIGTNSIAQESLNLYNTWLKELKEAEQNGEDTSNMPGQALQDASNSQQAISQAQSQAQQAIQSQMQAQQAQQQGDSQQAAKLQKIAEELAEQAKQGMQDAKQKAKNLQGNSQATEEIANGLQKILNNAKQQVVETDELITNWGLDEGTGDTRIPFDEKKKALERLRSSTKLRKLADAVGQMKSIAQASIKSQTDEVPVEIDDIDTGNDLTNLLPKELVNLSHKTLKKQFYKGYNEQSLGQYHKKSADTVGRGPMVVCLDESGSMTGDNEMWSKALLTALLEIANKQHRNFYCIKFAERIVDEIEFPKNELDTDKMLNMIEEFAQGGGTDFQRPLNRALDLIESSDYKKADVVFITDGEAQVDNSFLDKFNKTKKKKEFGVISMLMDAQCNSDGTLKQFSDHIVKLSNLSGDSEAITRASKEMMDKILK